MYTFISFFAILFFSYSKKDDIPLFSQKRLHLLDYEPELKNYIFRGNYPGGANKTYGYKNMTNGIRLLAKELELPDFPQDFTLVDVSLIAADTLEYTVEKQYWEDNPSQGRLIHWQLRGTFMNASAYNEVERNIILESKVWDIEDRIRSRIEEIRKLLTDKNTKNTVFYVHCSAGVDRTGEFCGSYKMKYMGFDFPKALAYDIEVKGGHITNGCAHMLNWYCFYLEKKHKKKLNCLDWRPWW